MHGVLSCLIPFALILHSLIFPPVLVAFQLLEIDSKFPVCFRGNEENISRTDVPLVEHLDEPRE